MPEMTISIDDDSDLVAIPQDTFESGQPNNDGGLKDIISPKTFKLPLDLKFFINLLQRTDPFTVIDQIIINYLKSHDHSLKLNMDDPFCETNLKTISSHISNELTLPTEIYYILQEHIDSLALLYQLNLIKIFTNKNFVYENNDQNFSNEVSAESLMSYLNQNKISNSKTIINHLNKSIEKFFNNDKNLSVVSIDFNQSVSLRKIINVYPPENYKYLNIPIEVWNSKVTSLSTLQDLPVRKKIKNNSIKYTISDNPFVFIVNCALLHKQIFVLGFDLQSELTFLVKNLNQRTNLDLLQENYPHIEDLITKKISMEEYIKDYIKEYSGLFQRSDVEMGQLLFNLHTYSKDKVFAIAKLKWQEYLGTIFAADINNWKDNFELWVQENSVEKTNNYTDLGWA